MPKRNFKSSTLRASCTALTLKAEYEDLGSNHALMIDLLVSYQKDAISLRAFPDDLSISLLNIPTVTN